MTIWINITIHHFRGKEAGLRLCIAVIVIVHTTPGTKTETKERLSKALSNTDDDELYDPEFFSNGNKLVGPDILIKGRLFFCEIDR